MNRLVVAFLAGAFAFGPASVCGEDEKQQATEKPEPSKSAETPKDKTLKATKPQPLPTTKSRTVGDFLQYGVGDYPADYPPYGVGDFPPYKGRTVDQWRQDEKRRNERLQQTTPESTTPKSTTLKSTDEERAERKRLVDEWEKTRQPAPK